MQNKISSEILNLVSSLRVENSIECIVYLDGRIDSESIYLDKEVKYYPFINAVGLRLDRKNIFALAKSNFVKYITHNAKVNTLMNVSNKIMRTPIDYKGGNFSVAVIDTGMYPHIDIVGGRNKVIKWLDLVNEKKYPYDDNGHGTFITGVLCGSGFLSGGKYQGVAPKSNIISIKALDKNGETGANTILSAMQWVYDNKKNYNIKVVCMSFGSDPIGINDPLVKGAEALWDKGIVVVGAGGNSGPESETIKSPGASGKIITVGALNDNRYGDLYDVTKFGVADFSSRGPIFNRYKPDVLAPGVDVVGACNFHQEKKYYDIMSGTSVSTPMIAGMCCHIIKNHPDYTPDMIKKYIINHCNSIVGDRNAEGYGWFRW